MKLQPDKSDVQTLTAHGPGWVAINNEKVDGSVVVGSRRERVARASPRDEDLGPAPSARRVELGAELIIFGSGSKIRFPKPMWLTSLMARRTGVETMDTGAACRTYNILAAEGRHVVAALIVEPLNGDGA